MNVSKILLLNRLNNSEFENYYFNGILNQYKKIIVLKDKECFINEITSKEVKIFSENSTRMIYLSGVYNEPTKSIKQSVREKYNLNNFEKNIVVNCGAGGWHIGSNVCESIFEEVIKITNNLVEKNVNVQTILVLGPYSDYLREKFKNIISSNIKIVDFETNLADGTYVDRVDRKTEYTVKNGKITCDTDIPENSVVVLYNEGYTEYARPASVGVDSKTEFTYSDDTYEVTLTCSNTDNATYSLDGGKAVSYKDGDKVTIKHGDSDVSKLELRAENAEGVKTYERLEFTYM